jgi:hypothetical protein
MEKNILNVPSAKCLYLLNYFDLFLILLGQNIDSYQRKLLKIGNNLIKGTHGVPENGFFLAM